MACDRTNKIAYGGQKKDGTHNHQFNRGGTRTPSQKRGDQKRRGPRK